MNIVQLANFLAILNKLEIESSPALSREEKELYKQMIDYMKKQVEASNQPPQTDIKP